MGFIDGFDGTGVGESADPVGALLEGCHRDFDLSRVLSESSVRESLPGEWPVTFFSRPLFARQEDMDSFARDLTTTIDVVCRLPRLLGGLDLAEFCSLVGIPAASGALLNGEIQTPIQYGRADVYHDGAGFKLLELGLSSAVGGVDRTGLVPELLLARPEFAAFSGQFDLSYADPIGALTEVINRFREDASCDSGDPVTMIEATGGLAEFSADWEFLAHRLRREGFSTQLAELGDLSVHRSGLRLNGNAVTLAMRLFNLLEFTAEKHASSLAATLRSPKSCETALVTPLEYEPFNSKGTLALLSRPAVRESLTAAERASIDRIVPGTVAMSSGATRTLDELGWPQDEVILKPTSRARGEGSVAGWEVTGEEWKSAVARASDGGYVAQRRVKPRVEWTRDAETGVTKAWHAVWGVFYGPSGFAGVSARVLPATERSIISGHDVRWAPVFLHPEVEGGAASRAESTT